MYTKEELIEKFKKNNSNLKVKNNPIIYYQRSFQRVLLLTKKIEEELIVKLIKKDELNKLEIISLEKILIQVGNQKKKNWSKSEIRNIYEGMEKSLKEILKYSQTIINPSKNKKKYEIIENEILEFVILLSKLKLIFNLEVSSTRLFEIIFEIIKDTNDELKSSLYSTKYPKSLNIVDWFIFIIDEAKKIQVKHTLTAALILLSIVFSPYIKQEIEDFFERTGDKKEKRNSYESKLNLILNITSKKNYKEALVLLEELPDPPNDFLNSMQYTIKGTAKAEISLSEGNIEGLNTARSYYEIALELINRSNYPESKKNSRLAEIYNAFSAYYSKLYYSNGIESNIIKAKGYLKKAKKLSLKKTDSFHYQIMLINMGNLHLSHYKKTANLKYLDSAIASLRNPIKYNKWKTNYNYSSKANLLLSEVKLLSSNYETSETKKIDLAINYYDKLIKESNFINNSKSDCYFILGQLYHKRFKKTLLDSDWEKSDSYYHKAEIEYSHLKNKESQIINLNLSQGYLYTTKFEHTNNKSYLENALSFYEKGIIIAEKNKDYSTLIKFYNNYTYLVANYNSLDIPKCDKLLRYMNFILLDKDYEDYKYLQIGMLEMKGLVLSYKFALTKSNIFLLQSEKNFKKAFLLTQNKKAFYYDYALTLRSYSKALINFSNSKLNYARAIDSLKKSKLSFMKINAIHESKVCESLLKDLTIKKPNLMDLI